MRLRGNVGMELMMSLKEREEENCSDIVGKGIVMIVMADQKK